MNEPVPPLFMLIAALPAPAIFSWLSTLLSLFKKDDLSSVFPASSSASVLASSGFFSPDLSSLSSFPLIVKASRILVDNHLKESSA